MPDEADLARRAPGRRAAARRLRLARPLVSLLLAGLLWELVGRFVVDSRLFFAPLSAALSALADLAASGELLLHVQVSGLELLLGLGLAAVTAIPAGVVIATEDAVGELLDPIIAVLYATPLVAVAPLVVLWLGIGVASKVAVVFLMAFFPLLVNTVAGIRSTDQGLIDVARAFGASRLQIMIRVLLRWALPLVLTGLRLAVGRALVGVVVGEMFGARAGLGFLILLSAQTFDSARLFAAILLLALTGVLLSAGTQALERRLLPWRRFSVRGE